jgi:hypothetical protein
MEIILLEITAYICMPSSQFDYDMLKAKIETSHDDAISQLLKYVGIKNGSSTRITNLMHLFMDKDMWKSCKYMIMNTKSYIFSFILNDLNNEDIRKFYLMMSIFIDIKEYPSLFGLFVIPNKYLCCELLNLYLTKYSPSNIMQTCKHYAYCKNFIHLMPCIKTYLTGIKYETSLRGNWILACVSIRQIA